MTDLFDFDLLADDVSVASDINSFVNAFDDDELVEDSMASVSSNIDLAWQPETTANKPKNQFTTDAMSLNILMIMTGLDTSIQQPTSLLRDVLYGSQVKRSAPVDNVTEPPAKKIKTEPALLHRACCRSSVTVEEIDQLLRRDPTSAALPMVVSSNKTVYDSIQQRPVQKLVKEAYQYPLNIAIKNKASPAVISALISAAPSVLTKPDGSEEETSLAVLLKNLPHCESLAEQMIAAKPSTVSSLDRRQNAPLHIACTTGAPLSMVERVCRACPDMLDIRNYHGQTPLRIAQHRISTSSEAVAAFLLTQ